LPTASFLATNKGAVTPSNTRRHGSKQMADDQRSSAPNWLFDLFASHPFSG